MPAMQVLLPDGSDIDISMLPPGTIGDRDLPGLAPGPDGAETGAAAGVVSAFATAAVAVAAAALVL